MIPEWLVGLSAGVLVGATLVQIIWTFRVNRWIDDGLLGEQ